MSAVVPCGLCRQPVNVEQPGVCQWTSGWVQRREGGGGHAVSCPERAPRWAHRHCVEAAGRGTLHQGELFPGKREETTKNAGGTSG